MPYLLMSQCYDYNDEYHTELEGGMPELVFEDDYYLIALEQLGARLRQEWRSCTPLESYYCEEPLSSLSSSDLGDDALAAGISGVLGKPMNAREILETDFTLLKLNEEQQRLIGLMLDGVGHSYLEFVPSYQGD